MVEKEEEESGGRKYTCAREEHCGSKTVRRKIADERRRKERHKGHKEKKKRDNSASPPFPSPPFSFLPLSGAMRPQRPQSSGGRRRWQRGRCCTPAAALQGTAAVALGPPSPSTVARGVAHLLGNQAEMQDFAAAHGSGGRRSSLAVLCSPLLSLAVTAAARASEWG